MGRCVKMCQFRTGRKKCVKVCLFRMRCVKMCQWYIEVHFVVLLFNSAVLKLFYFCSIYCVRMPCHAMYTCDGEITRMLTCGVCGCIRAYSADASPSVLFIFSNRPRRCTFDKAIVLAFRSLWPKQYRIMWKC